MDERENWHIQGPVFQTLGLTTLPADTKRVHPLIVRKGQFILKPQSVYTNCSMHSTVSHLALLHKECSFAVRDNASFVGVLQ